MREEKRAEREEREEREEGERERRERGGIKPLLLLLEIIVVQHTVAASTPAVIVAAAASVVSNAIVATDDDADDAFVAPETCLLPQEHPISSLPPSLLLLLPELWKWPRESPIKRQTLIMQTSLWRARQRERERERERGERERDYLRLKQGYGKKKRDYTRVGGVCKACRAAREKKNGGPAKIRVHALVVGDIAIGTTVPLRRSERKRRERELYSLRTHSSI